MQVKPIIFSAPMISALLAGRKSQTRRMLNRARVFATPEQPACTLKGDDMKRALQNASRFRHLEGDGWFWEADAFPWQAPARRTGWMAHIGWGPGDLLWVRETCSALESHDGLDCVRFDADQVWRPIENTPEAADRWLRMHHYRGKRGATVPSIHQPRWASRLTLEVTEVRVQRLQDISEEDVNAEGIAGVTKDGRLWKWGIPDRDGLPGNDDHGWHWQEWEADPRRAYAKLWNSLHGPEAWDANPWVAAITFTTHHKNIDALLAEREAA